MMDISNSRAGTLLADLHRLSSRLETAQRQISSGVRVSTASDAPDQVGEILTLRASLAANQQITTNLERAKSEVQTADAALFQVVEALDRVISLATEGAGTRSQQERATIAEEVKGLAEELVSLSRTTYGDRYLFSGDMDSTPSYQIAADGSIERLVSPSSTRQVQHSCGVAFQMGRTAQEIFDHRNADDTPSGKNIFAAVSSLRTALESDDADGIEAALTSLRSASAHANTQLGFYGSVENRISAAITDASKLELRLTTALSDIADADLVDAIMEAQMVQMHQSAAMQMQGMMPHRSLFEYLK
ncbi:MAG TPA: flagellin [Bryobacteraceae bacterium]|nr:flagellin [Bryobacteraceae bacterium]